MTENETADEREVNGLNLDEVEEQIDEYHDQLDEAKDAGQQIAGMIQQSVDDDTGQERMMEAQRLATKANLLYRRVENGDSSVVRGE